MCGIAGLYGPGLESGAKERLVKLMTDRLEHRGPDGSGYLIDDHVALGHRRLSIIDLAGGDQPIFNEDESIAIVFNGEIYNYIELRQQLLARGHKFKTDSDTEVIVHLYEDKGVNCLDDLNGMFAFAIWDANKKVLFVARDRLGEKPLYYAEDKGKLYFASELKSLLEIQEISRELDLQAIDDYLSFGYVPAPRSSFKAIRKLPAAHYLTMSERGITLSSYWTIEFTEPSRRPEDQLIEELRDLVNSSIMMRLRSDVPVGSFLSGGVDSSLIVSHAAKLSTQQLSTFSIGFSEADFDELAYARQVAERYQTNHHEFIVDKIDADLFPRIVAHFDEPFADPSAFPTYYVTKQAAASVKVVLSGDGGDELFCGYRRYQRQRVDEWASMLPSAFRRAAFGTAASMMPDSMSGKGWMSRLSVDDAERWQRTIGIFDSRERDRLWQPALRELRCGRPDYLAPFFEGDLDLTSKKMRADQNTYLCDDILVKVDRNSMWHSLEVRVPLLDHRIVEFANLMPIAMKYKNGILKYPLKKLLEGKVSPEIISRKKSGFAMPIKHWLKGEFNAFSRELLLSSDSKIHDYLDRGTVKALVDASQTSHRDLSRRVWSLLWLEQWLRSVP